MTSTDVRDRVTSVCASAPFHWTPATTPFSFDLMPTGTIDGAFRIESDLADVIAWLNYAEEHTERVTVWIARKYQGQPDATYRQLLTDCTSLRAAVIRDGLTTSGDYLVPDDGAGQRIERVQGQEYAVGRLTLPINFELSV